MSRIFKHLIRLTLRFDISPISPGGFSKQLIIIFWGINAVLFLANSVTTDRAYDNTQSKGIACTVVKKISSKDFYKEHTEIINDRGFIVISSYNFILPEFDVAKVTRDRSPPV